jgi:hypothetical protein
LKVYENEKKEPFFFWKEEVADKRLLQMEGRILKGRICHDFSALRKSSFFCSAILTNSAG